MRFPELNFTVSLACTGTAGNPSLSGEGWGRPRCVDFCLDFWAEMYSAEHFRVNYDRSWESLRWGRWGVFTTQARWNRSIDTPIFVHGMYVLWEGDKQGGGRGEREEREAALQTRWIKLFSNSCTSKMLYYKKWFQAVSDAGVFLLVIITLVFTYDKLDYLGMLMLGVAQKKNTRKVLIK